MFLAGLFKPSQDDGVNCPLCESGMHPECLAFDDRYGYPDSYMKASCPSCGHWALDISLSAVQLTELYTQYYPRSEFTLESWSSPKEVSTFIIWWRGLKASAFRWIPKNVAVLDIGCGFGESLGYHRDRGCDAQGVEADTNILRIAERYELKVRNGLFDAANYPPESFDYVTLDQVIEHVSDPLAVLRGIGAVLKPGGRLIIATPNANGWGARIFGRYWIHWHAPYHLQFFNMRSMTLAAQKAGLLVELSRTFTNSAWLDFQWCHLVTYPRLGEVSAYWSTKRGRTTMQYIALKLLRLVDVIGVNALTTRLFDALNVGDNMLFVLRKPSS